ncbi:MAG: flagellar motor switch protein FliN, partial [Polaromonas sp.]
MSEVNKDDPVDDAMDDWGSALAEQASAAPAPVSAAPEAAPAISAGNKVFQPLQSDTSPDIAKGD